ncbi:hypothetical protein KIM372_11080 [Bombiscardovia nodaiensis]|uniref:Uncharacterized protein n=1 Tax=Bombiscardovia nodaiensis TaxID=2932181 RepID=A0ABM8B8Y5_9BIFI|nr:hypothetical protein KIM372_11080 [Bombiscardovia nodaiensis]
MQAFLDPIFKDHDPLMIGCAVVIVVILGFIIFAFALGRSRSKRGIPNFKVNLQMSQILAQPVLMTSFNFGHNKGRQDEILFEKYAPGSKYSEGDYEGTISRWKKEETEKGMRYVGYFSEYEFREFPLEFKLAGNEYADRVGLTQEGLTLYQAAGQVMQVDWEHCTFKNSNYRISLIDPAGNPDFKKAIDYSYVELFPNQFGNGEYDVLEELLIKYANLRYSFMR